MKIRDSRDLAAVIRDFRLARGMTQAQLAKAVQASPRWVTNFETGDMEVTMKAASAAAAAVGLRIDISIDEQNAEADEAFREVSGG